jgi:hypothetical protein
VTEPRASRPHLPADYGVPKSTKGLLAWSDARARLEGALNYWVSTVSPEGTPHAVPVWGAWVDDRWYFDGSPETKHIRNVMKNPAASLHLEDGSEAVIVEGRVDAIQKPPRALAEAVATAYREKYKAYGYAPDPDQWDGGGLYGLTPQKALFWTSFPKDMTRFTFR